MKSLNLFLFLLTFSFFTACTKNTMNVSWKKQLEDIKSSKIKILVSNGIELLDYQKIGTINVNTIKSIREEFESNQNYIPFYVNGREQINVITLAEAFKLKPDIGKLSWQPKEFFENIIVPGLTIIQLKWKVKNKIIYTKCLVSNGKGIVFDYMLTNLWVFADKDKITIKSDTLNRKYSKIANTGETIATYIIRKNWTIKKSRKTLSGRKNDISIIYAADYESKMNQSVNISKSFIGLISCGSRVYSPDGACSGVQTIAGGGTPDSLEFNWTCWWSVFGTYITTNNSYSCQGAYPCGVTETGKIKIDLSDL